MIFAPFQTLQAPLQQQAMLPLEAEMAKLRAELKASEMEEERQEIATAVANASPEESVSMDLQASLDEVHSDIEHTRRKLEIAKATEEASTILCRSCSLASCSLGAHHRHTLALCCKPQPSQQMRIGGSRRSVVVEQPCSVGVLSQRQEPRVRRALVQRIRCAGDRDADGG